jgi:polysaccharide export outer membrane protein
MRTLLALLLILCQDAQAPVRQTYTVGPQDVLTITVVGEPDLSGKYVIDVDGTLDFPWIGRVKAQGQTLRALETAVAKRLNEGGYLVRPQVSIQMQDFRSQTVYVMGEVRQPGEYPLTGNMTIIDLLAKAVLQTTAGDEILISRRKGQAAPTGPVLGADQRDVEVTRVSKRDIQSGRASQTVTLRDGDTVFVPKAVSIFVTGQVRNPGSYTMEGELTVLQALSLAGGLTEKAARGRVKILRVVDGKQKQLNARMTDVVKPGDTIEVPSRFF